MTFALKSSLKLILYSLIMKSCLKIIFRKPNIVCKEKLKKAITKNCGNQSDNSLHGKAKMCTTMRLGAQGKLSPARSCRRDKLFSSSLYKIALASNNLFGPTTCRSSSGNVHCNSPNSPDQLTED